MTRRRNSGKSRHPARVNHRSHGSAEADGVRLHALIAVGSHVVLRPPEDVHTRPGVTYRPETSMLIFARLAGRFVSIAAIFPLRNGYIAHSIEAVLGIDHVPALHDQVVLCFLCGSERNKQEGVKFRRSPLAGLSTSATGPAARPWMTRSRKSVNVHSVTPRAERSSIRTGTSGRTASPYCLPPWW